MYNGFSPNYARIARVYSATNTAIYPTAAWTDLTPSTWGSGNSIVDEQFGGSYTMGFGPLSGVTVTWARGPDGTDKNWKA